MPVNSSDDSDEINPYDAPAAAPDEDQQATSNKPQTPAWGWAFFVACLAIMIATRGGAVWGALGGGVGGACLKISQNRQIPVLARFLVCAAITAVLWGVILALVAVRREAVNL